MTTKSPAARAVIKIKEINQKLKKDGKTPFWNVVTEDGDFYSVFAADIPARLLLGQANAVMVEETTSNGKTYRNVVGIAEPDAEGVDIEELIPNGKPVRSIPRPAADKMTVVNNMADIRAQALQAACLLAAHGVIQTAKIESQSNTFVNYLLHGKDAEHQSSSMRDGDGTEYIEG